MLIFELLAIWYLAIFVHVSALALGATLAGVAIREIRVGFGPVLLRFARYRIALGPFGGFVKMKDSREEQSVAEPMQDAFDHQPGWKQALIPLSGPTALLLLALLLLGEDGWHAFIKGFSQVLVGALAPLSEAQQLLGSFNDYLRARSFLDVLGLLAAKMAAINLLPLPMLNGGAAILALLGFNRASERTTTTMQMLGVLALGALWLSWTVAIAIFLLR